MIICFEVYSRFRVPKIIIIIITLSKYLCEFLRVQWLRFTAVLDKVIIAYFLFSEFYIPKLIKICSFLTELLKIKIPSLFLKHGVVS